MRIGLFYIFVFVIISGITLGAGAVFAVNNNIYLAQAASANPVGIINQVYQFALMIGGLLAFGAIVYGGIKYMLAAGNPSGQTEGKEWIKSALLGLLLLSGAYLVLNTINPNLTTLSLPGLTPIQAQQNSSQNPTACGGNSPGTCPTGQNCDLISGSRLSQSAVYQCRSPQQYTCGGDPPNSRFGTCPSNESCVSGCSGGCTPTSVRYYCSTR